MFMPMTIPCAQRMHARVSARRRLCPGNRPTRIDAPVRTATCRHVECAPLRLRGRPRAMPQRTPSQRSTLCVPSLGFGKNSGFAARCSFLKELDLKNSSTKFGVLLVMLAALGALSRPALSQSWEPRRNVEIVVGADPGGALDFTARLM